MYTRLSHCPACNLVLEFRPAHGHWEGYFCPTHQQFEISVEAMNAVIQQPGLMKSLGLLLKKNREKRNETYLIYKTDIIPKP